jgi:hypothetical protein
MTDGEPVEGSVAFGSLRQVFAIRDQSISTVFIFHAISLDPSGDYGKLPRPR